MKKPATLVTVLLLSIACGGTVDPPHPPVPLTFRHVADAGPTPVRIARDPVSGDLFVLKLDGQVMRLSVEAGTIGTLYTAADTGVAAPQGMAFGPDGTLYLVGNEAQGDFNVATVRRGIAAGGSDTRAWTTVARTEPYPLSHREDHMFNAIAVSADGAFLFLNSGARTDHGEVEDGGGRFPGLREIPLTTTILRVPAAAHDLVLPAGDGIAPYVYARGVRNAFDLAFSAAGELFAAENSGDRDDEDELDWIREGRHYGFPWRMGTHDTPQQFPGYDGAADTLVNRNYRAHSGDLFHDDPGFPPRPAVVFADPVLNTGPDAHSVRDPETGAVGLAAGPIGSFTPHRSPLGLVFDTANEVGGAMKGGAFVLGFMKGDAIGEGPDGPFLDASEDLLYLALTRSGSDYRMSARSIACGFSFPIDAELRKGRLYVLESAADGAIWEVGLPSEVPTGSCVRVP